MRRMAGAVLLAAMVGGCTSVRMMQREGCWVKQTERWPGQLTEELGPCERAAPAWADDRLTRLVQECMAQADYRWQNRALAAWSQGEPLPAPESDESVLQACMGEAAHSMVTENESLRTRLGELSVDREALRSNLERDEAHLRDSHLRLTDALGEAAQKPAGSAVATANSTSDGTATTHSDTRAQAPGEVGLVALPASPSAVSAPRPVRARAARKPAEAPMPQACETKPPEAQAPSAPEARAPALTPEDGG